MLKKNLNYISYSHNKTADKYSNSNKNSRIKMNCIYCNKETQSLHHSHDSHLNWRCNPCKTYYHKGLINMFSNVNNYLFAVQFLYEHSDYKARIIETKNGRTLVKFSHFPDINPFNINNKLKLYLTFS